MFRKLDKFIGRHMDARKWVWVWATIAVCGGTIYGSGNWWGLILVFLGWLMIRGNLRRLIPYSKLNTDQRNQIFYGALFGSDEEEK